SFQVAQSRLGTKIKTKSQIQGLVEIDFIDFNQSSPTTQSRPRLRRAFIKKGFKNGWSLQVGQDWDTFSPTRPDTYDIIGLYFNGGNTGFMREQIKVKKKLKKFLLEAALGQANKNTGTNNNQVEEDNQLSLAINAKYRPNDFNQILFSAITGRSSYSNTQSKDPYGLSLGYELRLNKNKLNAEAYYGQGLAQLNLLDIPSNGYHESFGGYLTYQREFGNNLNARLGQGYAKRSGAGGLTKNAVTRLSLTKHLAELQLYCEVTHFESKYITASQANTIETGLLFPF
ncbi:MAG: hypothetical protein NXH75_07180, partial [Halobacteriovoraceae bacterium]|nr:hypothetical protein [Halobacteriovoraceae bacterium]